MARRAVPNLPKNPAKRLARLKGAEGFELFYEREFGERWPELRHALLHREVRPGEGRVARRNRFPPDGGRATEDSGEQSDFAAPRPAPGSELFCRDVDYSVRRADGLREFYVMDPASILAARALPLDDAASIADLCAAPGGKTLIVAERMGASARLLANDRSPARRKRLSQTLSDYLPAPVRERVQVSGQDARRLGQSQAERFDAALLDAPCSSEAHVLADPKALAQWSQGRVERLAKEQYALLTSALSLLRPAGVLLYSTCALSISENDGVIQRLLDKGRHPVEVLAPRGALPAEPPLGQATQYGWRILPDRDGFGPLQWFLLRKLE